MREIPFFLLVALASLGQTQPMEGNRPTKPDIAGLNNILRCMDNPADPENAVEQAFVEHWKNVIGNWDKRNMDTLETEYDMRVSINTCAANWEGDPDIGPTNTKPWQDFFTDLGNLAATFICVERTQWTLRIDKRCLRDLQTIFKRKAPQVLNKEQILAFGKISCQKRDEHLALANLHHCAAWSAHNRANALHPNDDTTETQREPLGDLVPGPSQGMGASSREEQNGKVLGEQNGKVHADRLQATTTSVEQKGAQSFSSRLYSHFEPFLSRLGGILPKSSKGKGGSTTFVLPQGPVNPVYVP
ncbi:MAG: hypothetical protein M1816_000584 [Peltula sp. TS41687]|nr:MAG: hypothetical protein M1816_000584 [Peltula sp. TS41687]